MRILTNCFCQIILMFALIVPVLPVSLIHSRTHGVIFISTYRPFYSVLEAIRKHSPSCKFISISSAAVYGNPEVLPVSESSKVKPLSPYGWHKHYTEMICGEFYTYFKIPTCSVRIFSAYGPDCANNFSGIGFRK